MGCKHGGINGNWCRNRGLEHTRCQALGWAPYSHSNPIAVCEHLRVFVIVLPLFCPRGTWAFPAFTLCSVVSLKCCVSACFGWFLHDGHSGCPQLPSAMHGPPALQSCPSTNTRSPLACLPRSRVPPWLQAAHVPTRLRSREDAPSHRVRGSTPTCLLLAIVPLHTCCHWEILIYVFVFIHEIRQCFVFLWSFGLSLLWMPVPILCLFSQSGTCLFLLICRTSCSSRH